MSNYTIEAISFGPDGIRVSYMTPTDVRAEGEVFQAHTICISWEAEDLLEQLRAVEDAAETLVGAAILKWARSKPVDLVAERQQALDDDDDDGD